MRTTLDIDEGVLEAVKELARREGRSAGSVASDLIRRALTQAADPGTGPPTAPSGFRPFPASDADPAVSNERVNRIRDDLGI